MIMEVSDSTLAFDRGCKSRVYAQAGITQYCLLNLQSRELEDYRQPGLDGYRNKQTYSEHESFKLAAFPQVTVKVAELLPAVKVVRKRRRK
jgi:Uma2 family endonuclease